MSFQANKKPLYSRKLTSPSSKKLKANPYKKKTKFKITNVAESVHVTPNKGFKPIKTLQNIPE